MEREEEKARRLNEKLNLKKGFYKTLSHKLEFSF